MGGLTLLASYPKSGNTWMRAFLVSLMLGGRTPDINDDMGLIPSLAQRRVHDRFAGLECADLTPREVVRLRPFVSRRLACERPGIFKVHDANLVPPGGSEPSIPADVIDRVVYIVRDPRDVAVSSSHHFGRSLEASVAALCDPAEAIGLALARPNHQVYQWLASWSEHVQSWADAADLRVHLVRYEDMLDDPVSAFTAVVDFLGLAAGQAEVTASVAATAFGRLAEQEAAAGFRERLAASTDRFFRGGRAGGWRTVLPAALAHRIEEAHGPVMRRFGYL